jgi:uncharacterized protein YciI/ketosteroid isomerase-like protein
MKKLLATAFFLCGLFTISFGQKKLTEHTYEYDGTTKVSASIHDLNWLTGRWSGEGFGGWLEEIWSPPAGGQMLATFRMLENGKPVFSEICQIMEEGGTLTYKVKHFNPDLTGWEEKNEFVTFQLVKIEPNAVYFNGLTMIEKNGKCDIWLAMKQNDGSFSEEHLVYRKEGAQTDGKSYFIYQLQLTDRYKNPANWTPETQATFGRHAALLDSLGREGHLLFAGPTDMPLNDPNLFGIAILKASSLEEAQRMVAPDPVVIAGMQTARVLPYRLSIRHFENAPIGKKFPKIHIPQNADNLARLKEIDRDIWTPFAEAYATNNANKYLALHTPDFFRANGGKWAGVKDLASYGDGVRESFQKDRRVEIAFTFFERAAGEGMATERGIYRYTAISPDGGRQHFYGKFHVFLRKTGGTWKIAVDYDSDEDGRVGEDDFAAGLPPGVFAK